jgi:hypothetical protein
MFYTSCKQTVNSKFFFNDGTQLFYLDYLLFTSRVSSKSHSAIDSGSLHSRIRELATEGAESTEEERRLIRGKLALLFLILFLLVLL